MFRDVRLADLIATNPSIEHQMREWQTEQHQHGRDPLNWQEFRHLQSVLRGPDPGSDPPVEFYWFAVPSGDVERVRTRVALDKDALRTVETDPSLIMVG